MRRRGGLYGRPDRAALTAGLVVPAVRSGRAYSPPLQEDWRRVALLAGLLVPAAWFGGVWAPRPTDRVDGMA